MLSPEYLDRISDDLVEIYAQLEMSILKDISRRISKMNYVTSSAEFQLQQLRESGAIYDSILKEVSKYTNLSKAEVKATFESASIKSDNFENKLYSSFSLSPTPLRQSTAMLNVLSANIIKTNGDLLNLTRTTARTSQRLFIQSTTLAQLQVQSGAFTAQQAIRNAVKSAAKEGVTVEYPTGETRSIESAVRANVLTGVNQTAGALTDIKLDMLGLDLVQVSAHPGARDTGTGPVNHQSWQGKIFSRSGASTKYPDFVSSTGYGTATGLGGINCRHSHYGYVEGEPSAYTKEILDSYKRDDVTYAGKKMSYYEATQHQRRIERNIRSWKLQANSLESAGVDNVFEKSKVKEWQAKARSFTKSTGVRRDYSREFIANQ